jgi:hypothetical protein
MGDALEALTRPSTHPAPQPIRSAHPWAATWARELLRDAIWRVFIFKKKTVRFVTMDEVAQQISRVLGTEEEEEEEMNEPMLRSNSRNGLNSPGA